MKEAAAIVRPEEGSARSWLSLKVASQWEKKRVTTKVIKYENVVFFLLQIESKAYYFR